MPENTPDRPLKRGEYVPEDDTPITPTDLVRVRHSGLDREMVVRRRRLAQMDPDWEVIEDAEADTAGLKGDALDQALKDAGLPTTGRADEKRARLAEHEAAALAAASESNQDPAVTTTENTKE
jgi:hypothetical protein